MKKTLTIAISLIAAIFPACISAQLSTYTFPSKVKGPDDRPESIIEKMDRHGVFNRIEVAANIGTTGLGLEVASPMTKWTKLRIGFDVMPQFTIPMNFGMASYVDGQVNDKFDRIQEMMYNMSGMTIDQNVRMESKPTMTTFRLLVDVYPFQNNRHWHFTAGFFVGGSSAGKSINAMSEMPSLLALNMYDRLYRGITSEDFLDNVYENPHFLYEITGIPSLDNEYLNGPMMEELQKKFLSMGQLGVHVGDHKDGTPYMMMPDKDGTVSARAKVNRFRPYLGFGYGGALSPDGKWQASVDAGVQFWGGVPKVTTHDGTVLNDLVNLRGKVDTYMSLMKAIPVYPTIDFRISYTF
ncbi:MAG: hypothetical protein K2L11_00295 [Muribaculaceae bacterium]|nr:hypothetical protein [Muribaculaceae bacterium]